MEAAAAEEGDSNAASLSLSSPSLLPTMMPPLRISLSLLRSSDRPTEFVRYSDFDFFIMWERMSMGSGKTIVEFFSADIVFRVCKEKEGGAFSPEERKKDRFTSQTDESRSIRTKEQQQTEK